MPSLLRMPEVAAGTTEAAVTQWQVQPGAAFRAGEPIVTVETAKAVVDIEAEADGVFLQALVEPGADVAVGEPIALIGSVGEVVADLASALTGPGVPAAGEHGGGPGRGERIFASPLARRLARDAGLALAELQGTGPGERIVRRDVERAIAGRTRPNGAQPVPGTPSAPAPSLVPSPTPDGGEAAWTDLAHSRIRRAIAARLTESKTVAPHFYLRGTARADRLMTLRKRLNDGAAERVSVNDLVVKAVARAHAAVPEMNVVWMPDAVRRFATVDVAVAVSTTAGLVTPVLRDVNALGVTALARRSRELAERARAGTLRQQELEGGSITVTNLGMFGTEEFAAVINPPQSAILAVGAVRREPVVRGGRLKVGSVMHVTLSADHRPVDGAVAARWMQELLALLENPVRILA